MTTLQADLRAAAVDLVKDYAAYAGLKLNATPARPNTILPPCAFVDAIHETIDYTAQLRQRSPIAEVIVVHGLFDSDEAAAQKDAFIDGFLDWVTTRYHAAGANTMLSVRSTEDIPAWAPDWIAPDKRQNYYATQISVEGYGG